MADMPKLLVEWNLFSRSRPLRQNLKAGAFMSKEHRNSDDALRLQDDSGDYWLLVNVCEVVVQIQPHTAWNTREDVSCPRFWDALKRLNWRLGSHTILWITNYFFLWIGLCSQIGGCLFLDARLLVPEISSVLNHNRIYCGCTAGVTENLSNIWPICIEIEGNGLGHQKLKRHPFRCISCSLLIVCSLSLVTVIYSLNPIYQIGMLLK